jgi:hypothetical protein
MYDCHKRVEKAPRPPLLRPNFDCFSCEVAGSDSEMLKGLCHELNIFLEGEVCNNK